MRGRWKPGDVVMATVNGRPNVKVIAGWSKYDPQLRWGELSTRWADGDDDECWFMPSQVTDHRPLLLIDPEDAEQVGRIEAAMAHECEWTDLCRKDRTTALTDALRSLAQPATPEPRDPAVRVLTGGNIVGRPAIAGAEREWARGTNGRWACLTDSAPGFQNWSDLVASYGPVRFTGVEAAKR